MKKSKIVTLVLLSAALNACKNKEDDWQSANGNHGGKKVYMRSDTSAPYTHTRTVHHYHSSPIFWYYAFRPYSTYSPSTHSYRRSGFYSSSISPQSNVGTNSFKNTISRGGFGSTFRSSSSTHSSFGRSSSAHSSSGGHSSVGS